MCELRGGVRTMADENETVVIEMATNDLLRLNEQIVAAMTKQGYGAYQFKKLNLGFELPAGWPVDVNAQPALAQLIVLARKLNLRIVINDLNLSQRTDGAETG